LGGGIFTKAADVGADLVGKVEKGIPEDDPRNPAVIADNVGDNVGDVAGRGADLFESMVGENIGAMIIGASLFLVTKNFFFIIFPLLARALGIFATIFAVPFVKAKRNVDPMIPLRKGIIATIIFAAIGFFFLIMWTLKSLNLFFANLTGLVASILILLITEYYTSRKYRPVQSIANASITGSATNVITGFSVSLESTALPVVVISVTLLFAYYFGTLFAHEIGIDSHLGGIYGTAVATMGMLSIAGMVLGLDGFGPIADNAAGIIEMSGEGEKVRKSIDAFDAVGNTTKALTKGYAMGSAGLAALLLFQAYLEVTKVSIVDIVIPKIVVGLFIGVLLPFIFSSFAIRAVGRAAFDIVEEVRRQFKTIPGLMKGKAKPDYSKAIDISTVSAQKEMIIPGLLVLLVPIAIGFLLGAEAAGAFLMGATLSGFILAMMMNTGGAALDNSKKFIEAGVLGGKGSEAHKAAVVGDTFGDPMKDTAGPSLHILIKLINTISLVFGPLFLLYAIGVI
jgi:K(+)-stimulated pyrophosphate-energized sodium pump